MIPTLAVLAPDAAAQPAPPAACGVPLSEFEFRSLVGQSTEGIERDDVVAHKRRWDEFLERVPCLDGQLPKDAWAELLLNQAIVAKVGGQPWNGFLDTALRVYPPLDGVPKYLLAEFAPGRPAPPAVTEVPKGAALFVDGVLCPQVPTLSGLHVAQLWRRGAWTSAVLVDAPIPAEWLVPDPPDTVIVAPPEPFQPKPDLAFGAVVGPILGRQLVQDPQEWIGNSEQYALWASFVVEGNVPVAGPAGFWFDAALPLQVISVRQRADEDWGLDPFSGLPAIYFGASGLSEDVIVGLGGGFTTILHWQGEEVRTLFYPQPDLRLEVRRGPRAFALNAGLTPSAMHVGLFGGAVAASAGGVGVRLGADANLGIAWLTEAPPGERKATALAAGLGFRLDGVVGHDR